MKAAVCYEFGQPLVIEEVYLDPPQVGEVKVRLTATAICHSDIHVIKGEFGGKVPVVAGHEGAGIVEAVGEGVTLTKPGDAVVVSLLRSCGRCFYCTTGAPNNCEARWPLDKVSRLRTQRGEPIAIGTRVAAFAEYCIVDQSQVVPISDQFPLEKAALLGCGVITGIGAVINTAQVKPATGVAVIGCGGVGLNAIQGAALAGAYPIIAIDVLENKLETARSFGATHTLNAAAEPNLREAVRALTNGRGVDNVFLTVGTAKAMQQGFSLPRKGGAVVIVGLPGKGEVPLAVQPFVWSEQRVLASWMGSGRLSVDVPRFVALYEAGRLKLDELITARYPLEQINEAIASLEQGQALRNVIVF
ncbi:MAG: Zn-dependent alcohol dehydrogenase [Anaerolineae bacterium]|nr:Zn-dependent alcohol dehydrogenase [Anaerolineae bacterium]